MRRREFIAGLGSAAAWPLAGGAVPVTGFLSSQSADVLSAPPPSVPDLRVHT